MDTKQALLDSAENAVRMSGYDGFSYADLSREVGIRKASIHYHFPTKADLALELMRRYDADRIAQLAAIDARSDRAADRLTGQINRYRDALEGGNKLCLCVAFSISTDHLDDALIAQLQRYRSESIAWLTSVFDRAVWDGSIRDVESPAEEAAACLALLEGGHLAARAERDVTRFDAAVAQLQRRCSG